MDEDQDFPHFAADEGLVIDKWHALYLPRLRAQMAKRERDLEEFAKVEHVVSALRDGQFGPLAHFLRSAAPLPEFLRSELADMLEGKGQFFDFAKVDKRPGAPVFSKELGLNHRNVAIGADFERRYRGYGRGHYERARHETMERFNIKKGVADEARKYVRALLEQAPIWFPDWSEEKARDTLLSVLVQDYSAP